MLRAAVVFVVLVAALAGTTRAQCIIDNCVNVSSLPLSVSTDGACYKLVTDLTWATGNTADDTAAVTWTGRNGELHFRGYSIHVTSATGQAIWLQGPTSIADGTQPASLRVFDPVVYSTSQLYSYTARAFHVSDHAKLEVYNARTNMMNTVYRVAGSNSVFYASGSYSTYAVNRQSMDRNNQAIANRLIWDAQFLDVQGYNATVTINNFQFEGTQTDNSTIAGLTATYPLFVSGVYTAPNDTPNPSIAVLPGGPKVSLTDGSIVAHDGVNLGFATGSLVQNVAVRLLPIIGPSPSYTPFPMAGITIGGRYPASVTVLDCSVDMSVFVNPSFRAGLMVFASAGSIVDGMSIIGVSAYDPNSARQVGLVDMDAWIGGDWDTTEAASLNIVSGPVLLRKLNVKTLTRQSYAMTIGNGVQDDDWNGWRAGNFSLIVEDSVFSAQIVSNWSDYYYNTGIGVLLGSGSGNAITIRRSSFNNFYWTFFLVNASFSIVIRENTVAEYRCGVTQQSGSIATLIKSNVFLDGYRALYLEGTNSNSDNDVVNQLNAAFNCAYAYLRANDPNGAPIIYDAGGA
jgi:hypothetical protein